MIPLPPGKLPNRLLQTLLYTTVRGDESVIVGPEVGEDAAVLQIPPGAYMVAKSDPITFATDQIGYYAIHVNANDIASMGGVAKWFLSTLLLPQGTAEAEIFEISRQVCETAGHIGVVVCGGHTEITSAVERPVICGTMAGYVLPNELKKKSSVGPGQVVVMTKSAGNEGTAILARECGRLLRDRGVPDAALAEAAGYLGRLSVLPEASIGRSCAGVTAMHDVTEGGVATALRELVAPSGCGIETAGIPVSDVTLRICSAADVDPLGLIGSGSLLIAVESIQTRSLLESLHQSEIPAEVVATVVDHDSGRGKTLPEFPRDEIARFFESIDS